jgi:hypothetical protein
VTALVVATVYLLQAPVDASFLRFFQDRVRPVMAESGAEPVARFQSLEVPNNFPALPVREGEHAFVWFSSFEKTADYDRHLAALRESPRYAQMRAELDQRLKTPPQQLKLVPTFKSLIGPGPLTGDVHDFDFLEGDWDIHNWRLKQRGVGGNEWDEFPATSRGKLYLGGVANIDEIVFPTKGWSGLTVRTFDFATRQWSIYWVNSTSGELRSPVRGGFTGDHGEFFGEDDDGGKPIKVIFHWQRLGPGFARWSQEFSYDGGKTWETNWINELRRPLKPRG